MLLLLEQLGQVFELKSAKAALSLVRQLRFSLQPPWALESSGLAAVRTKSDFEVLPPSAPAAHSSPPLLAGVWLRSPRVSRRIG